jgi:undecaprenyl-diphosphatase
MLALKALIMGVVEGFTEFLPISSTGHLILAGSLLNFTGEKIKTFEIVIQAGAIFAVCWEYRAKIIYVITQMGCEAQARQFVINLAVACLPAALLGFLFAKNIQVLLFTPVPVALAFIVGGVIILWAERRQHAQEESAQGQSAHEQFSSSGKKLIETVDQMSLMDAFKVGCAQAFALIPGTSRSGATIIGGMLFGLSRKAATEFSFFLAIPTLLGATVYSLYKARTLLTVEDVPLFAIGTVASFVSAFLCVRWLLRYISSHDFTVFAWYRIGFGIVVLLTDYMGWAEWVA